ncbi:HAD-IIA family hydrolase [Thalassovita taeanensis]|uniref:HAD-superfamily class IIA hydrolase, TIGR01459 n=1 Tax=Thalassovita taeanensis TaxID=657014 RepID=A0A1H9J732_9RHOB|nr:HAD hydrolase-like protein [Thalassovita taeanensis]SEQ82613.1 HAD-superfamily class IIA hydrolase, TIGR01459 [Thalassovita taeanensis]
MLTRDAAIDRYNAIRARLPQASGPAAWSSANNLGALAAEYDVFVFDAFGVLNVGATPITGAHARIQALQAMGKQTFVLTNAAGLTDAQTTAKFCALGLDFEALEVISSRQICLEGLKRSFDIRRWGVICPACGLPDLPGIEFVDLITAPDGLDDVDGIVLLSTTGLPDTWCDGLEVALRARPRPVVVGNPDLVAPRETGLSKEPGFYAHDLIDRLGIAPVFYGKPFANAFEAVERRLTPGFPAAKIAMIGDTLHTDILGAAARGWGTVLVTGHGLYRGANVDQLIEISGIVPNWVIPSI